MYRTPSIYHFLSIYQRDIFIFGNLPWFTIGRKRYYENQKSEFESLSFMGEAKRRKEALGTKYGHNSWHLPKKWRISNSLKQKLAIWIKEGLIITLLSLIGLWLMFRFFPVS